MESKAGIATGAMMEPKKGSEIDSIQLSVGGRFYCKVMRYDYVMCIVALLLLLDDVYCYRRAEDLKMYVLEMERTYQHARNQTQ